MNSKRITTFPDIDVLTYQNGTIEISSYLRKAHTDGKYYLTRVCVKGGHTTTMNMTKLFIHDTYKQMCFAIIDPTLKDHVFNTPFWKLDENQESEFDRLNMHGRVASQSVDHSENE